MTAATHYENANFLRELAESLPRIRPQGHSLSQAELLQRLADDELAQAQHDEWIRAKVDAARADNRPTVSTDEVMARLGERYDRLSRASR
ncbi:MAG TPA: plasmid stabilization protein [Rhodoferax sp.]